MGISMLFAFQTLFFKKLKVSSNKYNWYRHFVYLSFVFLNPIFLYKLDALKKITKLSMILCFGLTSTSMLLKSQ